MTSMRLTLIALATALSIGTAYADAPRAKEVIVVTAPKPERIEVTPAITIDQAAPSIDYSSLVIEPPKLDRRDLESKPRTEVVLSDTGNSKS
jgi:hypothetical protein